MNDFKNPLLDPNIKWNGKTLNERAEELIKEQKKAKLKARLGGAEYL